MPRRAPLGVQPPERGLVGPGGKQLIVHVVINAESWAYDRPMPRKILGAPHGVDTVPDVPNFSWVAYGMRRGLPRFIEALGARQLPATVALNASVIEDYPEEAAQLVAAGYELIGHGVEQETLHRAEDEAAVITASLSRLEALNGRRVRGWLGPGLQETFATLDHLAAAGIDYVFDWVIDDVPVWLEATPQPVLSIPYSLELNDSVLFAAHEYPTEEYLIRLRATLSRFDRELAGGALVLALPLHPHLLGVAHRIGAFEEALDLLLAREDTAFLSGSEIYDWYVGAVGRPRARGETAR